MHIFTAVAVATKKPLPYKK